ncbi:hypothetical protein [uncultured Sphaerochaeta sp.]|uniref:hypothetical protein n=2 Tax=uncultured Sphaerochaeta sp. TaxID=886478 RepID=UPI002AA8A101|nr:hypothetical protein [uncultured Sphaerochaeta sp.]
MHSIPMRIQWFPTWLHKKSRIFLLLMITLLLATCSKEEIVVVNLEHERTLVVDLNTGKRSEHLLLSFDLLGEERSVQVRLTSSNSVSSWLVDVQGETTSSDTAHYRIGPLTMGEEIPFPSGIYEIDIINEDGIIRKEQLELPASPLEKMQEVVPLYDSDTAVVSSLPVPSQIERYDETGRLLSAVNLSEPSYTLKEEDASLAIVTDDATYLLQR